MFDRGAPDPRDGLIEFMPKFCADLALNVLALVRFFNLDHTVARALEDPQWVLTFQGGRFQIRGYGHEMVAQFRDTEAAQRA